MTIPLALLPSDRSLLARTAVAWAVAATCVGAQAAPTFTFDPSAVGLQGTAFTADTIQISDYSTVTFSGLNFTETGYLPVSGFQNQSAGTIVSPTGLNSGPTGYGLYFKFDGAGTLNPPGGNPAATPTSGTFTTLTYSLFGYNGPPASFGVAGNTPSKSGTTDTLLATGTLKGGTVSTVPTNPTSTSFTPTASVDLNFAVNPASSGFFVSPSPTFYNLAFAAFTNLPNQVSAFPGGFNITAGGGSVNFASAVPEPETYAMFLAGIGVLGFLMKRRRPNEG